MDVNYLTQQKVPPLLLPFTACNGNTHCIDCKAKSPEWCSLAFGLLICLDCAGAHRALGVHVTLVRSLTLDSWDDSHINALRFGGNSAFMEYFHACEGMFGFDAAEPISSKYIHPDILYYRY